VAVLIFSQLLTPAVLRGVEWGRFAPHGLTPAVLTGEELGKVSKI